MRKRKPVGLRMTSLLAAVAVVAFAAQPLPSAAATGDGTDNIYTASVMFSNSQDGPWHYMKREVVTNAYTPLEWTGEQWEDGMGGIITKDWMHASADASDKHEMQICLEWEAPDDGTVEISVPDNTITVGEYSNNGVMIECWQDNTTLWSCGEVVTKGTKLEFKPLSVEVKAGQKIRFLLTAFRGDNGGDMLTIDPTIKYTEVEPPFEGTLYPSGTEEDGIYYSSAMFSDKQTGVWHYLKREAVKNEYSELTWNGEQWEDGAGGMIANTWMHASADASDTHEIQICLEFEAPSDGTIELYVESGYITAGPDSGNGVRFAVWQNSAPLIGFTDLKAGEEYPFVPLEVNVLKGDKIRFLVTPINGDNAGDSLQLAPIVVYTSTEAAPPPVIEEKPDEEEKTVYRSYEEFGAFVNPWYYRYWKPGSQKTDDMTWNQYSKDWSVSEYGGLMIGAQQMHPYPGYDAVRVFRAPKTGTIRITMLDGKITLTGTGTTGTEDGVYVSIKMNDGISITDVMTEEWLFPQGGEDFDFEPIEIKIYEGWELWFVLDCNQNNANDATIYAPIIEYLEITDEPAPVNTNRDDELQANTVYDFSAKPAAQSPLQNILTTDVQWLPLLAVFGGAAVVGNAVAVCVWLVVRRRRRAKATEIPDKTGREE